jgi:hypothetical protein
MANKGTDGRQTLYGYELSLAFTTN